MDTYMEGENLFGQYTCEDKNTTYYVFGVLPNRPYTHEGNILRVRYLTEHILRNRHVLFGI